MKKRKNSSTLALSAALLALMLMTAACNDNGTLSKATPSATPTTSASASPSGEVAPEDSNEASADPESETQEAAGEYVGLIDSHSIEVKMEDGPVAFQVSPELAEQLDPWESNIPVKFRYTEQKIDVNGEQVVQYTIVSIDKQ